MAASAIDVVIGASDAALAAGMRSAADIVRGTSAQIKASLDSIKGTALGVGNAMRTGFADGFRDGMREADRAADRIEANNKRAAASTTGVTNAFGGLKSMLVGLGIGALITDIVKTNSEFERLRAILATLEGSEGSGNARFAELKKFSTDTPFQLAEVVEAFSALKSQGLDPSNAALASYGNTAAAMGRSLDQMVEAVADSATGEYERLKEFGIKAKDAGDSVIFTFKGVSTEVSKSGTAVQDYLQNIGNTDFAGAMERQMDTLGGAFSNVQDAAANLADILGTGGLGAALRDIIKDMTSGGGNAEMFAAQLGDVLGSAVKEVWELIKVLGSVVGDVFATIADVIRDVTGTTTSDLGMVQTTINVVKVAFVTLGFIFREVAVVISTAIRSALVWVVAFGDAAIRVTNLDFSGAVNAVRQAVTRQGEIFREGAEDMVRIHTESAGRAKAAWNSTGPTTLKVGELSTAAGPRPSARSGGSSDTGRSEAGGGADKADRDAERAAREAERAAREQVRIARDAAEQIAQINQARSDGQVQLALAGVDAAQMASDLEEQLGLISAQQRLTNDAEFEQQRFQIKSTALQERLALMQADPDMNPVEFQRLKNEIQAIELEHQSRVGEIRAQSTLESNRMQMQGIQTLSQSWGSTLASMLVGQQSFAQGVSNLWKGLVGAITQALMGMIAQWIARQIAAFVLSKVFGKTSAIGQISANAGVAGSAAFASTAAIPIVGPALAPAAAAAAAAGAMAFNSFAFAEKGYDIPAGINPITQLHQKEMVLPAEQADVVRDMAANGGAGGQPIHFYAPGSMSRSEMERHAATLISVLANARQNRDWQ